eukprot:gene56730-biopygen34336
MEDAGASGPAHTFRIVRWGVDTFEKSSNVDNGAYRENGAGCGTWYGSYQEATQRCLAVPTCTTLFDMNDDGRNWRFCDGTMGHRAVATAPGTAATFTRVRWGADTFESSVGQASNVADM